jgi:hypothetical protein
MAKKTVFKRMVAWLGIRPSSKLGQAVSSDDEAEDAELPPMEIDIPADAEEVKSEKPVTDLAGAREKISKKKPEGKPPEPKPEGKADWQDCSKTTGCILGWGHPGFCKGKVAEPKPEPASCEACGMATGHVEGCPEA